MLLAVFLVAALLVADDLIIDGTALMLTRDRTVDGSVFIENGGHLALRDATLTLELDFDEEHHIGISDDSRFTVESGRVTSTGGQYWIELTGDQGTMPMMGVSGADSLITSQSGIRPFGDARVAVSGGDVVELQVRERTPVTVSYAATYPVFFFDGAAASLALAFAGSGGAATYHVAREHPQASDQNPGSETLSWRTLGRATAVAGPGDTVLIHAGVYPEALVPQRSGTSAAPVTFAAAPGAAPVLDGSLFAMEAYTGLVHIDGVDSLIVRGLLVRHARTHANNYGIAVHASTDVTIEGCSTEDTSSSGIIIWASRRVVVAGNEVKLAANAGAESENECLTVGETDTFEVRDNHVHHGNGERGEGIDVKDGSVHGKVHGNHVHHVQGVGIYVDAWDKPTRDISVDANVVHDVDGAGFALGSEEGGLLERVKVCNNLAYRNLETGLTLHACCSASHPVQGVEIVNNTFVGNGSAGWGGGVLHENDQATGVVLRNNLVADNLSFQIAFEGPPPASAAVDHNLVEGFRGYPGELRGAASVEGDPRFVDRAGFDLHLREGSPAIDAASPAGAPRSDAEGVTRPQRAGFDIGAFEWVPGGGAGGGDGATDACVADDETLCLQGGRFRVRVSWRTPQGESGSARASRLTGDTGFFWFFRDTNVEAVVKVLDGCPVNGRFWVFAAGLTDVEVELEVADTRSAALRRYRSPAQTPFEPVEDVAAFTTCP